MVQESNLLRSVIALVEDETADAEAANANSQKGIVDTVTRSKDTASDDGIGSVKTRKTEKRKRNPDVKWVKFARPKPDTKETE